MARKTEVYNRSLAGSVGAGIGSLMGMSGKRYYVLEHKVSSRFHKAGESQQIIIDQIELGRGPKCQVRFDDSFTTVSRRHAAIVRDGDNWKLVQLSNTNSTLLNGVPVKSEWYLQNGDEIQLSVNGPKLGFIVPQGDKSLVKSIGLSRRLSLFRHQALLPYKKALWAMACVFVLCIAGLSYWNMHQARTIDVQKKLIENQIAKLSDLSKDYQATCDEFTSVKNDSEKQMKILERKVKKAEERARKAETKIASIPDAGALSALAPNVYYISTTSIILSKNGETKTFEMPMAATGFLLADGTFVTARHCVEPWCFFSNDKESNEMAFAINAFISSGGSVSMKLNCYSNNGSTLSFTNHDFRVRRGNDRQETITLENGQTVIIRVANGADIATVSTGESAGLIFDKLLSQNLMQGEPVFVLGYPYGLGAGADTHIQKNIQPSLSESKIARSGVSEDGLIQLSNKGFEPGNSGGPVFVLRDGKYVVVGVVSSHIGTVGFVTPISEFN